MIDIMKQGLGQARPNKTAFAQQNGGTLPRQVPAEALLGTVNEQRQGITITVTPCLCYYKFSRLKVITEASERSRFL